MSEYSHAFQSSPIVVFHRTAHATPPPWQTILQVQLDVTWAAVALHLAAQQYTTVDHPVVVDINPAPSFYAPEQVSICPSHL
jgi:hypothetical protein